MYPEKPELLIGGKWCQGSEGVQEPVINPATEEVIAQVPHASASDLDRALTASADGFKVWKKTSASQRQKVMFDAANLIEDRIDTMAQTLTMEIVQWGHAQLHH